MLRSPILLATLCVAVLPSLAAAQTDDPLAPWRKGVQIRPVAPGGERHTIHSYFNTCPESPDGRWVLFFSSTTRDAHHGEVRIRRRDTGDEQVLARDVHVEDAHRVACQQWLSQGKRVSYHGERDGKWGVTVVDVETLRPRELAAGRLSGWGQPHANLLPLYGPHWNPGERRHLELLDVESGDIRQALAVDAVQTAYPDWWGKTFGDQKPSIFFPILSPDLKRVFFKMATPTGGDPRSKQASVRQGLICYSLAEQRFLYMNPRWGHPSWQADGRTIVETSFTLFDSNDGHARKLPELFKPSGDHPTASPDGRLIVTDTTLNVLGGKANEWGIILADARGKDYVVLHKFDNSKGASSWRRSHPHPSFSPDGKRLYFNVSAGNWTELYVAERGE